MTRQTCEPDWIRVNTHTNRNTEPVGTCTLSCKQYYTVLLQHLLRLSAEECSAASWRRKVTAAHCRPPRTDHCQSKPETQYKHAGWEEIYLLLLLNWEVHVQHFDSQVDRSYVCAGVWCLCELCSVYLYLRAVCMAEQSASSLFTVKLICSDSPFLLSRAAVRRSFLALSLSMYLEQQREDEGSRARTQGNFY